MIQIKNAAELEKMRKACAISAAALKAGGEAIEPGITTAEIDKIIYDFIVRHGARPNFLHLYGFPATACISVNDTVIHGIPSRQQQIRPGDIVSIDTGCKIDGFNGDNACTYACGKIDLEAQRLLDVTKEGLHRGIEMARGGNRVGDIGHAVQSYEMCIRDSPCTGRYPQEIRKHRRHRGLQRQESCSRWHCKEGRRGQGRHRP